jgi:hypothetical protein
VWGGEGAYWSGTNRFKFSPELHVRSVVLDLVRFPCTVSADASTNSAAEQVWLKRLERYLVQQRDFSFRWVWPSAQALTFEMVRQWNMEHGWPTGISEAMVAGLRGNMSRYMEHVRAARSWPVFIFE